MCQEDVVARLQPAVSFSLDSAGIADNLCKVEVFYEQFDYESIEESEAYPVTLSLLAQHIHSHASSHLIDTHAVNNLAVVLFCSLFPVSGLVH